MGSLLEWEFLSWNILSVCKSDREVWETQLVRCAGGMGGFAGPGSSKSTACLFHCRNTRAGIRKNSWYLGEEQQECVYHLCKSMHPLERHFLI